MKASAGTPGASATARTLSLALFSAFLIVFYLAWVNRDSIQIPNVDRLYPPNFSLLGTSNSNSSGAAPSNQRHAFATLLAGIADPDDRPINDDDDGYFMSTRVMVYQLLHAANTSVPAAIDVVVFATPYVPNHQLERLERDGAKVIVVDPITTKSAPGDVRWQLSLSRFHLWEHEEYDKICYIDADTLITGDLSGVFADPASEHKYTDSERDAVRDDEEALPSTYLFAGKPEAFGFDHPFPPNDDDMLNAGFFVASPSVGMYNYYMDLVNKPDRVDLGFMDQGVFNYAHRKDGNMPWQVLDPKWNINFATENDYDQGCRSFHDKYWDGKGDNGDADPFLKKIWQLQKRDMLAYYKQLEDDTWFR